VTGERFGAERALAIGLIHDVVAREQLDTAIQSIVNELLSSGPAALRACKALALNVGTMSHEQARNYTAETIANLRVSPEGQEGLSAFLEKRKTTWTL
jgi:methylglutaconyl-CoA hydratase